METNYVSVDWSTWRPIKANSKGRLISGNGRLRPDSDPEALFLAGFVLGAAMWLAWARWWRWV